ncbi:unnamed protein product, partial [marine sediment metagenome]
QQRLNSMATLKDQLNKLKDRFKKQHPELPESVERMKEVVEAAKASKKKP